MSLLKYSDGKVGQFCTSFLIIILNPLFSQIQKGKKWWSRWKTLPIPFSFFSPFFPSTLLICSYFYWSFTQRLWFLVGFGAISCGLHGYTLVKQVPQLGQIGVLTWPNSYYIMFLLSQQVDKAKLDPIQYLDSKLKKNIQLEYHFLTQSKNGLTPDLFFSSSRVRSTR